MLLLLVGAGCKDSNSGKGDIEGDGSIVGDGGGTTPPDGSVPDGSIDGGGGNNGEASVPDGTVPDGTVPGGGDDGGDAGGNGNPDGGGNGGDAGDAGGTPGLASAASVEFGTVPCGGDAPTAKTFSLTNSGTIPVTYSVSLSSTTAFSIEGSPSGTKSGTIAPATAASITINAAAVPDSATAGQAITASATITTNLPAPNNSFVVPLSIVPQGAHLQLAPIGGADWLLVQAGQEAAAQAITLQNTGNVQAAVTVTQPTLDVFSLRSAGAPATILTVPPASGGAPGSAPLSATFNPQVIGPYASSAALSVDGPVCNGGIGGASVTAVPFEGAATGFGFTAVATTPLPTRANCGATGTALPKASYSVGNSTATALLVSVSLVKAGGSPYTLSTNALSIAPGSSAPLDVTLLASEVPTTATPGTVLSDFVVLTPQVGSGLSSITVPLTTTVQGSVLTLSTVAAFTGATNATVATGTLTVSNSGNYPASPTFTITQMDPVFSVTTPLAPGAVPGGTTMAPGQSTLGLTFRPLSNDVATKTGTIALVPGPTDVICGVVPAAASLTGTPTTPGLAVTDSVFVGSGSNGQEACPLQGAAGPFGGNVVTVPLTNTGTVDLVWTATVTPGFTLNPLTATITPGATGNITVTPDLLPFPPDLTPNAYGGTITITTNIPNYPAQEVDLVQSAYGAVVTATTLLASFGEVNVNATPAPAVDLFTLTNTGNATPNVTLTYSVTNSTPPSTPEFYVDSIQVLKVSGGTDSAPLDPALGPVTLSGTFDPVNGSTLHGDDDLTTSTLTTVVTASGPLCAALPANILITGTGTAGEFQVAGSGSLTFPTAGNYTCGSNRAAEPKTLVVTNYGNLPLQITGLTFANDDWFTAYITNPGNTTATVAGASNGQPGTAVVIVAPKLVPAAASTPPSALTDTLNILAEVNGTPDSRPINLTLNVSCTPPP